MSRTSGSRTCFTTGCWSRTRFRWPTSTATAGRTCSWAKWACRTGKTLIRLRSESGRASAADASRSTSLDEGVGTHEAKVIMLDGRTGIAGKPYRGMHAKSREVEADCVHLWMPE